MKYEEYQYLLFERHPDGILLITINRPDVLNATNGRLHWELSRVWKDVDEDPETNVVIVTGKGRAFSAGGDLDMIDAMKGNHANISQAWKEAGDIVYNMIARDSRSPSWPIFRSRPRTCASPTAICGWASRLAITR
jgi:enoyl-CoA hydratase